NYSYPHHSLYHPFLPHSHIFILIFLLFFFKNSKIRHFLGAAENSNLEISNEKTSFIKVVHLRDSYNI
ncbi:unnamed protein product, partial [Prunus brigantina]